MGRAKTWQNPISPILLFPQPSYDPYDEKRFLSEPKSNSFMPDQTFQSRTFQGLECDLEGAAVPRRARAWGLLRTGSLDQPEFSPSSARVESRTVVCKDKAGFFLSFFPSFLPWNRLDHAIVIQSILFESCKVTRYRNRRQSLVFLLPPLLNEPQCVWCTVGHVIIHAPCSAQLRWSLAESPEKEKNYYSGITRLEKLSCTKCNAISSYKNEFRQSSRVRQKKRSFTRPRTWIIDKAPSHCNFSGTFLGLLLFLLQFFGSRSTHFFTLFMAMKGSLQTHKVGPPAVHAEVLVAGAHAGLGCQSMRKEGRGKKGLTRATSIFHSFHFLWEEGGLKGEEEEGGPI